MTFEIYVLRSISRPGQTYVGQSSDVIRRLAQHNGEVSTPPMWRLGYTRLHRPWMLVHRESFSTRGEAIARERQIKRDSRLRARLAGK
jgi:putative endonuclease